MIIQILNVIHKTAYSHNHRDQNYQIKLRKPQKPVKRVTEKPAGLKFPTDRRSDPDQFVIFHPEHEDKISVFLTSVCRVSVKAPVRRPGSACLVLMP